MFKNLVPFDINRHGKKKIRPVNSFKFAEKSFIASLVVTELSFAAPTYPVVFLKDEKEKFGLYALLGLKQDENLFLDKDGKWKVPYIPAIIRRYPFALGRDEIKEEFIICIDEESEFLNDYEGEALTDKDGKPTKILEQAKEYLAELYRMSEITDMFCKEMVERDMLTQLNIQINDGPNKTPRNISGCFGINEKKLTELSDADFLDLRKKGALPVIYAHLISLPQIERLVKFQDEQKKL